MDSSFDASAIQEKSVPNSQEDRKFHLQLTIEYAPGQQVSVPLTPLLTHEEAILASAFIQSHDINLSTLTIRQLTSL